MDYKKIFEACCKKLENHMREIPKDNPEFCACEDGKYFENPKPLDFMDIQTWMPSFFTGQALLAYEWSKEKRYLEWLEGFQQVYYDKVYMHAEETMHDLGFLYLPYAVGLYRLTGEVAYRTMALKAADELAKRFSIKGRFIRAWGRKDDIQTENAGEAIIDCMMNLPLLFWASEETGIPFYREIAIEHADTTLKYFVRADGSVYHAYRFDVETGKPLWGCNYCGFSDESFWARGCAWAVYGFMIAYTYTGLRRFIDVSERLIRRFQEETEKNGDKIPVWDFRLTEDKEQQKDTSAAAIVASAAYGLAKCTKKLQYKEYAETLLNELCREEYFDSRAEIPGMLKESNGLGHYTLFGDFFFMEALLKAINGNEMDVVWRSTT